MPRKALVSKEVIAAAAQNQLNIDFVLRELFKLPTTESGWTVKGVNFPTGTMFRCWWKDRPYWGEVRDGALCINGRRFSSPSEATAVFTNPPINGWRVWEARLPNTRSWVNISQMRKDLPVT